MIGKPLGSQQSYGLRAGWSNTDRSAGAGIKSLLVLFFRKEHALVFCFVVQVVG